MYLWTKKIKYFRDKITDERANDDNEEAMTLKK